MNSWEKIPEDTEAESLDDSPKRGRGRPKGSTTRVPESLLTLDKLRTLYTRVKPILPEDERKYVEGVLDGSIEVDPVLEMRILVRQMSVVFSEATVYYLAKGGVGRDYAAFGNNLRMAITDLYSIDQKERDRAKEAEKFNDMVRLTEQGAALDKFQSILGEVSNEGREDTGD